MWTFRLHLLSSVVNEQDSDDARRKRSARTTPYNGMPDMPLPGVEDVVDGEIVVVANIGAPNVFTADGPGTRVARSSGPWRVMTQMTSS